MNTYLIRQTSSAFRLVALAVAAMLVASGCNGTSAPDLSTVGGKTVATPLPYKRGGLDPHLAAGTYLVDLASLQKGPAGPIHLPKIAITLPDGWQSYKGYAVLRDYGGASLMGLSFWDVNKVYGTPCRWRSKAMVDPGSSVSGLAAALARQPLRNATAPIGFNLAGYGGKYLRLSVPRHIDFAHCDDGTFESWTGLGWADDRSQQGAGQVDRILILNIDGQRLVVDANYLPSATAADQAELDHVVQSIRFLQPGANADASLSTVTGPVPQRTGSPHNGRWIAYSTAAATDWKYAAYDRHGSDIYMTQAGHHPTLVASRGNGSVWNICPTFSPDGTMLAYASVAHTGSKILDVHVGADGPTGTPTVVLSMPGRQTLCPRWSSDSSRLAYLDPNRTVTVPYLRTHRTVIVRGLDGSRHPWAHGDPTAQAFTRRANIVSSPDGRLVAYRSDYQITVSHPNGTAQRIINDNPASYAISGWSPDGREILLMRDVGGGFTMRAVSIEAPYHSTTIADYVPVNNARSWPKYGDVSWQPAP